MSIFSKLFELFLPIAEAISKLENDDNINDVNEIVENVEPMYHGVKVSDLDALARTIYHGIKCYIDENGFLVFKYKSNRGHQTMRDQLKVDDDGNLLNYGGHYPGQIHSRADEFAEKANEMFNFDSQN